MIEMSDQANELCAPTTVTFEYLRSQSSSLPLHFEALQAFERKVEAC
jgi:hypothetical protein